MRPDRATPRRPRCAWLVLLLALAGWPLLALPPEVAQPAQQLPVAAQQALRVRQALLDGMTPAVRRDLERRVVRWDAGSRAEREQARARWQAWQALPDDERTAITAAARAFAVLPVAEQQALRQQFQAQEPLQQRGWLLGPTLGRDFIRLAPLLLQVPSAQREPLLQVLRQLTPQQRADLGVLAQRIPPEQREQLRSELLATPAVGRAVWLHGWLDR